MSKIKLFSGMDFSGKTTIIKNIDVSMPGTFKVQKKFLTPIDMIEKVRNTWLPPEKWKPLLQATIEKDITDYQEDTPILQDTLWIIKYIATKLEENNKEDYEEISTLKKLLNEYPDMDSFYLITTMEERIKRFNLRKNSEKGISGSDKILLSEEKFKRIEENYKKLVLSRFPNTKIIDTTNHTPEEIVNEIMKDNSFFI